MTIPEDRKQFYQENIGGRLSRLTEHFFPGISMPVLRKNGKLTNLNAVNKRKRVELLIDDYPELHNDWKSEKYDFEDHAQLVELYNSHFEMNK